MADETLKMSFNFITVLSFAIVILRVVISVDIVNAAENITESVESQDEIPGMIPLQFTAHHQHHHHHAKYKERKVHSLSRYTNGQRIYLQYDGAVSIAIE